MEYIIETEPTNRKARLTSSLLGRIGECVEAGAKESARRTGRRFQCSESLAKFTIAKLSYFYEISDAAVEIRAADDLSSLGVYRYRFPGDCSKEFEWELMQEIDIEWLESEGQCLLKVGGCQLDDQQVSDLILSTLGE